MHAVIWFTTITAHASFFQCMHVKSLAFTDEDTAFVDVADGYCWKGVLSRLYSELAQPEKCRCWYCNVGVDGVVVPSGRFCNSNIVVLVGILAINPAIVSDRCSRCSPSMTLVLSPCGLRHNTVVRLSRSSPVLRFNRIVNLVDENLHFEGQRCLPSTSCHVSDV